MNSFAIPESILGQHLVVLGKTGSGKSSVLRVMVEHLLSSGKRVVVIDPKGDWYGLKIGADGKSAGFPVIAFGEFKEPSARDVPINPQSGKHVAELIATGNRPAIIGFRGWMQAHMSQFWIDFASTLFNHNSGELFLVGDEFHNFAPKGKVLDPQAGKCLHWSNRLLSEGRGLGLICMIASQRPQKVHNDTLTCCETLVAMRVVHKADRDAVKDWIDGAGDAEQGKRLLAEIAGLKRGVAYVWSPENKFGPTLIAFPMFRTFDSFAPPQLQKKISGRSWADIDLEAVKQRLASVIEEHKANDPTELKKQIADLRRQLAARPAVAASPVAETKIVEVPVLKNGQLERTEKIIARVEEFGSRMLGELGTLRDMVKPAFATRPAPPAPPNPSRPVTVLPKPARAARPQATTTTEGITARQQKFLDIAATLTVLGVDVTRESVCGWQGIHPRGGSVGEMISGLVDLGLLVNDRGTLTVTEAGMAAANQVDPATAVESAKAGLTSRQTKFFEVITAAYPAGVTREAIAEQFQIHPRGGSLGEDLGRLVGRGLIERDRGEYRARAFLFAR